MSKNEIAEVVWSNEAVQLDKPAAAYELSKSLKKIIVENRLYANVKGKNFVTVEGWQLAGAFTGIFPRVKSVERIKTSTPEVKYRAEVSLFNIKDGHTVGYGVAFCSNKEPGKTGFEEYAVASMAQTRAVSKAYRMTLGWLMKLAGYEATPAEEMSETAPEDEKATQEQLDVLSELFEKLGKTSIQRVDLLTKAKDQSKATIETWIDEANRQLRKQEQEHRDKLNAIDKGRAFREVSKPVVTPDRADDIVKAEAERDALEQNDWLNQQVEDEQYRRAW